MTTTEKNKANILTDRFGRIHDYLRISLTDNCNFRCSYCMPDLDHEFTPHEKLMTAGEIRAIAEEFVRLGVNKIRLTGGEPLIRKDFPEILSLLAPLNAELLISTNGFLLDRHLPDLLKAGIRTVNISLDSLRPEVFFKVTGQNKFERVWKNIHLMLDHGLRVKINVVAIKGIIEKEVLEFIDLTRDLPLHVRFIEFMPFTGNHWAGDQVVTASQLLEIAMERYDVVKLLDEPHATARKYMAIGHKGSFAFITTMSNQFCHECNRLRITAEGKLKNCLFGKDEIPLLELLRSGRDLHASIQESLQLKHKELGGQFDRDFKKVNPDAIANRSMISIGG